MIRMKFTCTLLSDIILNQNAGSKEKQSTLDFIPGNVFLGIAASKLYGLLDPERSMAIFHSGKVRFGDAHPLYEGKRTLKIPAVLYYKKGESLTGDGAYVMYKWNPDDGVQPKQCRNGFYAFSGNDGCIEVKTTKNIAIKSAYDRNERRSKDEAMFAYESLGKGMRFAFDVECDDENLSDIIKKALVGRRHAGHSRTAQYGLVNIQEADFAEIGSLTPYESFATVYADSRLIFMDAFGNLTFRPTAQDLGFGKDAKIDWDHSQIRIFQYAPWNAKRQVPDADRCGIEKGSVFVINLNGGISPSESAYVGCYKNEGFGKVIYNPEFLKADDTGKSTLIFKEDKAKEGTNSEANADLDTYKSALNQPLMQRLMSLNATKCNIYDIVNEFVSKNARNFRRDDERFASQWGYIKTLAERSENFDTFQEELDKYLSHGVAQDKWQYKRLYLDKFIKEDLKNVANCWREIMINLSAEMAKKCK
ncbi:MAG: hypothetical protein PUJ46_04480 [Alistipes sp.]|nr:hypothetical protein [Alistipes sp.]